MKAEGLDRLTDKQRECLRLVYAHKSSKQIALLLGVAPGTIDQYVKAAIKILGAADRRDAAILLAEHERKAVQPSAYQSLEIASASRPMIMATSTEGERQYGATSAGALREDQAFFHADPPLRPRGHRLPLPIWGDRPSDLSALRRLGWIFAVMVLIALSFGIFLTGVEALSRLGRAVSS